MRSDLFSIWNTKTNDGEWYTNKSKLARDRSYTIIMLNSLKRFTHPREGKIWSLSLPDIFARLPCRVWSRQERDWSADTRARKFRLSHSKWRAISFYHVDASARARPYKSNEYNLQEIFAINFLYAQFLTILAKIFKISTLPKKLFVDSRGMIFVTFD